MQPTRESKDDGKVPPRSSGKGGYFKYDFVLQQLSLLTTFEVCAEGLESMSGGRTKLSEDLPAALWWKGNGSQPLPERFQRF